MALFLKRINEAVRRQHWDAIFIEFVIVVLGVMIGNMVANWNAERLEAKAGDTLILQALPVVELTAKNAGEMIAYYDVVHAYGERATRAWADPALLDDEQFVVSAYQASQIIILFETSSVFGTAIGADAIRNIDDKDLRWAMLGKLSTTADGMTMKDVDGPYREHVRNLIPLAIQEAIRAKCGDQTDGYMVRLPKTCGLDLPASQFAQTAAGLRAHPELVGELAWQMSLVANIQATARNSKQRDLELIRLIKQHLH